MFTVRYVTALFRNVPSLERCWSFRINVLVVTFPGVFLCIGVLTDGSAGGETPTLYVYTRARSFRERSGAKNISDRFLAAFGHVHQRAEKTEQGCYALFFVNEHEKSNRGNK